MLKHKTFIIEIDRQKWLLGFTWIDFMFDTESYSINPKTKSHSIKGKVDFFDKELNSIL